MPDKIEVIACTMSEDSFVNPADFDKFLWLLVECQRLMNENSRLLGGTISRDREILRLLKRVGDA
jgi:hypothetical protein